MQTEWYVPFLPTVGVLVGWFLNELAARLRLRSESRRKLGEAIKTLLSYRNELRLLSMRCDNEKDFSDLAKVKEFEAFRKTATAKILRFANDPLDDDRIKDALRTLCEVSPVLGYRLENELALLSRLLKADFRAVTDDRDTYIRVLSFYEVAYNDVVVAQLAKTIRRLSYHMGPWVAWTVRQELKGEDSRKDKVLNDTTSYREWLLAKEKITPPFTTSMKSQSLPQGKTRV